MSRMKAVRFQPLRLFSLTHRLVRGDLISMCKIIQSHLEFPMEPTFTQPTRKGLRGHAFKFQQKRCCTRHQQFAFTIQAVPFWKKTAFCDSQRILGEVPASTPRCPLAVPAPRSTHLTRLFQQAIPSTHNDPSKNLTPGLL